MKKTILIALSIALALTFTTCNGRGRTGGTDGTDGTGGTRSTGETGGGGGKGDLQKWTAVSDSTFGTSQITAIAYGNNRFVAGGSNGKMAYSANGASWTAVANSTFGSTSYDSTHAIAYGGGRWVAMGGGGIAYSDDNGVTWTAVADRGLPTDAIAYGNNRFVAGGNGGKMAYSDDGANWTAVADSTIWDYTYTRNNTTYTETAGIQAIAYGNNRFVAVGGSGGKMAYSDDGASWTAVADSTIWDYTYTRNNTTYTETAGIENIAFGNNRFVAVGGDKIAYSTDNGVTWTAVANTTFTSSMTIEEIAYGNNRFVAVGASASGTIAYSDNGVTWTAVEDSGIISIVFDIAYGNNRFVAVGSGGKMAYADW